MNENIYLNDKRAIQKAEDGATKKTIAKYFREKYDIGKTQSFYWAKRLYEKLDVEPSDNFKENDSFNKLDSYQEKVVKESTKSGITAESVRKDIKTLDDLIKVCEIDLNKWEIEKHIINKWDVGVKIDDKIVKEPLYQIKAWLKPICAPNKLDFKKFLKEELASCVPQYSKQKSVSGDNIYMLFIPDLHLGKLAWSGETGYENYDSKIAMRLFEEAVDDLIANVDGDCVEKILLPIGNDFFHIDNLNNTTTAGTLVDTDDSRWQKMFRQGCKLLRDTIDKLYAKYGYVDVIMVQGNHDKATSFYLAEFLSAWFRNAPTINFINHPKPRNYYQYGKTLFGFTHGNFKGANKVKELPLLMANEAKDMWSNSNQKIWFLGHYHQELTSEIKGVKIHVTPSLCATDAWHSENQFVGSLRQAQGFLYNKEKGIKSVYYFTV